MMNVTKPAANRIDIVLSGPLDKQQMSEALDDLIAQSEGVTHGKMLYTILDFEIPTMGAIAAEIARMPSLLSLLTRFDRCAVLTNTAWLRTAAEIEGALIPRLAIKGFARNEAAAAEAWLNDSDDDETENVPV